ncbi:MAPEG-domain-containing protein [Fomitiporia mediterranea MF3/22]|uniref:MAPEG-domain-containing protein n=1 Tax=Fomitiporia mediterranea (strain MF3/22) TaxID=694068 RepID=UPI0004408EE5|nr:MAPEG-domain-containing protein [Fomitiporia mediterranea MF3/22]EJD03671.1 MAPEG-domain-containing protein [Fomitiporia mediterranea MF3/22]
MPSIEVPQGYSYVIAVTASSLFLNAYQQANVNIRRAAAKVPYPQAYAEKAEAAASFEHQRFNCAQRAHQNTLEYAPHVLLGMHITGLKYPILAASLGAGWVVGRILYTINYSTGYAEKRQRRGAVIGSMCYLGRYFNLDLSTQSFTYQISATLHAGLIGTTAFTAWQFLKEGL